MRSLIPYLAIALIMSGCCASWRCHCGRTIDRVSETIDSVSYRSEELEVPIPAESVSDSVALGDTSLVQTSIAEAQAWVEDGQIRQRLRNRSDQMMRIKLDVPLYFHSEKEYITRTVTQEVEKPLGWFKKTLMYAGIATIAAGVIALISVIIRYRNKI
jgi:hypothetical protein